MVFALIPGTILISVWRENGVMVCEESPLETAPSPELLKIASPDSSPSSAEFNFRELDDAFLQVYHSLFHCSSFFLFLFLFTLMFASSCDFVNNQSCFHCENRIVLIDC